MEFKVPRYCLHKASGRAYSKWKGVRKYFGEYGTPESREAHAKWAIHIQRLEDKTGKYRTTVARLCVEFLKHAETFYRDAEGSPTGEAANFRYALKPLVRMFGKLLCSDFSPLKLKQVRDDLVKRHVRIQVNRHIHRIRHVFKWGVENELAPGSVLTELECVSALRRGRSAAKESSPVLPVPMEDIEAAIAHMTVPVATMVRLQLLTGARPSEIRLLKAKYINTQPEIWEYRPIRHKNTWRGKERIILFGPRAQTLLLQFICGADPDCFLIRRNETSTDPYTLTGYLSSIEKACKAAGVPKWSPGRLRHSTATTINQLYGDMDASRVYLGHSEKSTTEIYAERDLEKAAEIARAIG